MAISPEAVRGEDTKLTPADGEFALNAHDCNVAELSKAGSAAATCETDCSILFK